MTILLRLEPQKEAKLIALAQERGVSADDLVREAIDKILATVPDQPTKPKKSAYGLLSKYGPGPTEEEIDENRQEIIPRLPRELSVIAGVADTHAALWYLLKHPRLSVMARDFMDEAARAGHGIAVSPISMAEILYLTEKNRRYPPPIQIS